MKGLVLLAVVIVQTLSVSARDEKGLSPDGVHPTGSPVSGLQSQTGLLRKSHAIQVPEVGQSAMGVALDGHWLYCAAGTRLHALDVSEPTKPKVVGVLNGMDNCRQVAVSEGFAYVVSRETGLRIVDVRDPKNMKLRSRYDSVEFATGIDVVGKTVFLSERIYGVEAVDVSDPDNPRHLCIRKTDESQSNRYRDGWLYSGEWGTGKVTVFDARDMCAFRPVGKLELGGFGDGLEISGRYLYCSTGHDARHHHAKELLGGCLEEPQDALADPTLNPDALIGAGRGLDIFDLSDPAKPRHVSRVNFPVFKPRSEDFWTVRVDGGLAFCCDSHNGFFVVDVKDPGQPKVVDRFCVPQPKAKWPSGAISSVAIGEGCVYLTSYPGGLWVIPVDGVRPPKYEKGAPPANPTAAEIYPTDEKAFHVYRPAAAGQARTVCVRGDIVYAAFGDAGLHVLKLHQEGGFEKLGELPGGKRVTDCCFVGEKLVTAEGLDGWGVYELEGPAVFREVARRPSGDRIAFWCWAAGTEYAVLSPRSGPYQILPLDGFARPTPLCQMSGTCQWDKYLPDGLVGNRLAILNPYRGLMWFDFSGSAPKPGLHESNESELAGNQGNGVCVFGDRYLRTVGARYQFVSPDGTRTELRDLPPVPAPGKGKPGRFSGIPRSDGRLVVLTNRSGCRCAVYDFSDQDHPRLLRAYGLAGNPDLAALWRGRAVIPAGHQGLLVERQTVGTRGY